MPFRVAKFFSTIFLLGVPTLALAQQIAIGQYVVTPAISGPVTITAGPDGALWFTELDANRIGRMTTAGSLTAQYPVPTADSYLDGITAGPDGALWFTETWGNKIGCITTAGSITEYTLPVPRSSPTSIAAGTDGALWFTLQDGNIGRITTAGVITAYPVPTSNSIPIGIVAGPDGALWFTESGADNIGRITTAGVITEFHVPATGGTTEITVGPDGALWFTESNSNKIGRITTAGEITVYPLPANNQMLFGITAGPDAALWFVYGGAVGVTPGLGRITTAGVITEYPVPLSPFSYFSPTAITVGPDGELWFTNFEDSVPINGEGVAGSIGEAFFVTAGLTISPDSGFYRTSHTFTGSGFAPNEAVQIYTRGVGSAVLATATADATGAFSVPMNQPPAPYGPSVYVGVGQTSRKLGAANYTVTPNVLLSPDSGPTGTTVTAEGHGFPPFSHVNVYWGEPRILLGEATADFNGTFTGSTALTFTVPESALPGPNRVQGGWACVHDPPSCPNSGYGPFTVQ